MPRSILILCCAAAVLLSTGCGGSSGRRLSEPEFRDRANHICTELNRKEQPDVAATSKAGVERNLGRIDSALSELEGLKPPTRDESRYRTMLTNFKRSVAFVKTNETLLLQLTQRLHAHPSDAHTMARYQSLVRPLVAEVRDAATAANALGLSTCANGLTGGSRSGG